MSDQYYIFSNNNQSGPFPLEEIKQRVQLGEINAQSLLWQPGMADWAPIGSIISGLSLPNSLPPNIPPYGNQQGTPIDLANYKFEGYGLVSATKKVLSNYVNFSGRATRSEYWYIVLAMFIFNFSVGFLLAIVTGGNEQAFALASSVFNLLSLGLLLPVLGVAVRRLHDIGKSAWYLLMGLIPLVGPFIMLYYYCCDSQRGRNQWGQSEKYPSL